MSEEINFEQLANVKAGEVKAPPKIPSGHYACIVAGPMVQHKAKSGNLALRFPVQLVEALSDVDAEQLEEAGGMPDKKYNLDFWMSPDARFIFTNFGLKMGHSKDLNIVELAEAIATSSDQFMVEVKTEQDQTNPDRHYTNVSNAAPLDSYAG